MDCIYAPEDPYAASPSLFLAGPTPRSPDVPSWRPEAIRLMEKHKGTLIIPEPRGGDFYPEKQVEWEWVAMQWASMILFWIPRDLATLPGFTTNVEFGYWMARNKYKCVLAYPEGAPKMSYLHKLAVHSKVEVFHDLERALLHVVNNDQFK